MEKRQRKTKLDMGGIHEEKFEGLEHQQGVSIRQERVKTSNSRVRTLTLVSSSFGAFLC
jgi:hypothetical protein